MCVCLNVCLIFIIFVYLSVLAFILHLQSRDLNLETCSTHAAFPGTYICIPGDEGVVDQVVDVRLEARHLEAHQLQPRLQAHVIRSTHCGFSNCLLFGAFYRIKNKQIILRVLISISHRRKLPLIFHFTFLLQNQAHLKGIKQKL